MNRAYRAIIVLSVLAVGLWGCSQGPSQRAAFADRIKALETKCARLDDEFKAMTSSRDTARQNLAKAEDHIVKLQAVVKERDELRVQLQVRTNERDQVTGQFDIFRRSLRDMLGQADATVLRFPDGEPVTVTIALPRGEGPGRY